MPTFPQDTTRDLHVHSRFPRDIDIKPSKRITHAINSDSGAVGGREIRALVVDDLRLYQRTNSAPHIREETSKSIVEGATSSVPPRHLVGIPLQGNGADIDIAGPGRRRFEIPRSQLSNRMVPGSSPGMSPRQQRELDMSAFRQADAIGKNSRNGTQGASTTRRPQKDGGSVRSTSTSSSTADTPTHGYPLLKSTSQQLQVFRSAWDNTHHLGHVDMSSARGDPLLRVVPNDEGSGSTPRRMLPGRKAPVPIISPRLRVHQDSSTANYLSFSAGPIISPRLRVHQESLPMFDKPSPEASYDSTTQLASGSSLDSVSGGGQSSRWQNVGHGQWSNTTSSQSGTPTVISMEMPKSPGILSPRMAEFSPVRKFPDLSSETDDFCSTSRSVYSSSEGHEKRAAALVALARVRAANSRVAAFGMETRLGAGNTKDLYRELRYGKRDRKNPMPWVS